VLAAIRDVAAGEVAVADQISQRLLRQTVRPRRSAADRTAMRLAALTSREREVVQLVVDGKSNAEIATALALAPRTVSLALTGVFQKVGQTTRTQVAIWAVEQGPRKTPPAP